MATGSAINKWRARAIDRCKDLRATTRPPPSSPPPLLDCYRPSPMLCLTSSSFLLLADFSTVGQGEEGKGRNQNEQCNSIWLEIKWSEQISFLRRVLREENLQNSSDFRCTIHINPCDIFLSFFYGIFYILVWCVGSFFPPSVGKG